MFEIFTQAERSLDRAEGGIGLGLTIVQKLTEMHGGRVEAHSEGLGKGSTFSIRLPAAPPAEREPTGEARTPTREKPPAVPPAAPGTGSRVLVVDDNPDAVAALARILRHYGCEVETALDGPAAIERARRFRPTTVLLDIGLPSMDGYEVGRLLRREECCARAQMVAVTGYGQEEDVRRSREAGFDRHMVKPVDVAEIKRLVSDECGPER